MPLVKFCGLTRPEDALAAGRLGAAWAGVIFAGGPRLLTGARAAAVLSVLPPEVRRVGVFGAQSPAAIAELADEASLHAVQLHAARGTTEIEAVRGALPAGMEVWGVVRVAGGTLPDGFSGIAAAADALVVDSLVPGGQLGGTGVAADWEALSGAMARVRRPGRFVLAGGLRPENVERAVSLLSPDVLDVSSGVESAPGVKDHARMTAFSRAAQAPQPAA